MTSKATMTVELGQIGTATIQAQVYQKLREALFTGLFSPGQSLTIRALAAQLGTSPMPVREALQKLVAEKALIQLPNRTFRVTPYTTEMFRELTNVRVAVEGLAVKNAARRMTPRSLRELRGINDRMRQGIDQRQPMDIMMANRDFHFALYELAGMPQLMEIINGLWLRAGPFLMHAHRQLDDPIPYFSAGNRFHARLLDACDRQEYRVAARALSYDILYSARYFRGDITHINLQ